MSCDSDSNIHLEFKNVSKVYGGGRLDVLKAGLDRLKNFQFNSEKVEKHKPFYALKNVSFKVKRGEKVGILGHNGAGKSTTLKLIQGVTTPTSGTIIKNADYIGGLIELGAGFDPELTATENVYLGTALLGHSEKATNEFMSEVFQIAELSEFANVPLKKFSSGMKMKLGFAVAMTAKPEIVLLDEVLSVGDLKFKKKSMKLVEQYLAGRTLLFVSHGMGQIKKVCDRVIILNQGELYYDGGIEEGITTFESLMGESKKPQSVKVIPGSVSRGKSLKLKADITEVKITTENQDHHVNELSKPDKVKIKVDLKRKSDESEQYCVNMSVYKLTLNSIDTLIDDIILPLEEGVWLAGSISFDLDLSSLYSGSYRIDAWLEYKKQSAQVEKKIVQSPFEIKGRPNRRNRLTSLKIKAI